MCEVGPNMVLFELPLRYQFRDRHSTSIRIDDRALAGVVDEQCSEAVQQFLTRDAKSVFGGAPVSAWPLNTCCSYDIHQPSANRTSRSLRFASEIKKLIGWSREP